MLLASLWTRSYSLDTRTQIDASPSKVCRFLTHEPERYLAIADVCIVEQVHRKEGEGEWIVSESVSIPFASLTTYRIRWEARRTSAQWQSWAALGVHVKNTFSIDDSTTVSAPKRSTLCETATLTCSFLLYPIVKPAFVRAHERISKALAAHLAAEQDDSSTTKNDCIDCVPNDDNM